MLRKLYVSFRRRRLYARCLRGASRVVILRYHAVNEPAAAAAYTDPGLAVSPARFREQLRALSRHFDFLLPDELERPRGPGERPGVLITFDDGYRDNVDIALPILRDEGARAAFYVTTGPLDPARSFWISELRRLVEALPSEYPGLAEGATRFTLRRALTRELAALPAPAREERLDALAEAAGLARGAGLAGSFMRPENLRTLLGAGMCVGAHTRTHPHLDRLEPAHHDEEVRGSREDLEELLGAPIRHFAYPNPGGGGEALEPARASVARAGFATAVTSVPAPLDPGSDPLRLPRLGVYAGAQEALLFGLLARGMAA